MMKLIRKLSRCFHILIKRIGIKNSKKSRYIVKSSKPLEKEEKFGEIIHDVLEVWKLFMNSLKELLDNVSILKSEVDKFY